MRTLVDAILQGYGSLVSVTEGEASRTFRAFVRPVTEKGWQATRSLFAQGAVCLHWAGRGFTFGGAEIDGAAGKLPGAQV